MIASKKQKKRWSSDWDTNLPRFLVILNLMNPRLFCSYESITDPYCIATKSPKFKTHLKTLHNISNDRGNPIDSIELNQKLFLFDELRFGRNLTSEWMSETDHLEASSDIQSK